MNIALSVIVPIYNVEQYLINCIDSIIAQNFENFEVILVDDGSPDNCGKICDEYAKKDKRIKVVHKENGGLSDARNAGLKIARGKYISFIDSDDTIEEGMYENLYSLCENENADIAVCGFQNFNSVDIETIHQYNFAIYDNAQANCAMLYEEKFWVSAWNKIYKKELFEGLLYPKGKIYEDLYLTPRLIHNAKKVVVSDKVFYNYRTRENSIMGQSQKALNPDIIDVIDSNLNFFIQHKTQLTELHFNKIIAGLLQHLFNCTRQVWRDKDLKRNMSYIKHYKNVIRKKHALILTNKSIKTTTKYRLLISGISFSLAKKLVR